MNSFALRMRSIAAGLALTLAAGSALADEADVAAIVQDWAKSAHADVTAEAFAHWNDEGEVPPACVMCHAGAGLRAFYGLDGSPAGEVTALKTGGVIDCDTCHVEGAQQITPVTFPSGIALAAPKGNGTCFTCHQGRQSGPGVAAKTDGMDPDAVNSDLSFQNPHYKAAAATLHGADGKSMFEYPGKEYAGLFAHAPEPLCTSCHNPHTLEVMAEQCTACHQVDDPKAIRVASTDFDGDGDVSEGLSGEVATLHAQLGDAILTYARDVAGTPMIYSPGRYPYYFTDTNANGAEDEGEAAYPNKYASWTPRLLHAAFNYQFVAKDPGGYAHNPDYVLQVLIDSIADITQADVAGAIRP